MQSAVKVDERISKCEEILEKNPDSVIFAALSDAYRRRGDLAKAFHVCSRGLKSHPDYGPGHLVMAKINLERGMYSEAEKELTFAVQADGKTRATELLLAQILVKKKETKDAKRILEKLKIADPENELILSEVLARSDGSVGGGRGRVGVGEQNKARNGKRTVGGGCLHHHSLCQSRNIQERFWGIHSAAGGVRRPGIVDN
jgi:predicted Zn-dependent protease